MKRISALSLCLALGACAEYGFDPMTAVSPKASEVQSLDSTSTSQLYLSVVNGLLSQGRYRAALAYLDQYAVKEKKTPYFQQLYGEALLGTEQYEQAGAAFATLRTTPLAPDGFNGLGRVKAAQGDWPGAAEEFARAVAARPSSAEFLNNLGYAQLSIGGSELQAAEFNLRQAQELDPASGSIRNNLLIALMMAGKDAEARRLLAGIPASRERAEVRDFAASWVRNHQPAGGEAREDM
ncbi:Tetratricopeptide TPR_2 repeat protein [Parvibaculum lavamentivorans DS-1]|uniref:Tetratricopeptide TPR_2 repeat protein n=1 Tax=Parvibaculum lavamentivorans (strain DS-1 / DSM 13023 / NCIMB 13966) TaxID=402881 RepID=A7HP65_PARL1|nr:tetratricopeptide repeat protein [Parvibaculum lavamentivorans]ABS61698.1 Tetratricopeptide TPR_2 repeat protein [Parvibaculum lavamentivorans DS-1]